MRNPKLSPDLRSQQYCWQQEGTLQHEVACALLGAMAELASNEQNLAQTCLATLSTAETAARAASDRPAYGSFFSFGFCTALHARTVQTSRLFVKGAFNKNT